MSLKPLRAKRRSRKHPLLMEGGNWNFHPPQFHWNPSARISKILMLALIVTGIALVPLYGYYQFDYVPNQPGHNGNPNYDPFTTLWNGTNPAVSPGPVTFVSMQNGTASAGGSVVKTFTVTQNDFLIVAIFEPQPVTVFTVSDTQGNAFTQRAASPSVVGQTQFQTGKAGASGSDTVTVSSTLAPTWDASILQYSGVSGFGSSASSEYTTGTIQSGTDNLALTTSASSSILEIFAASSASAARCSDISTSPNNGQTNREIYCPSGTRSLVTDVTGFSGTNSIGFTFSFNASQINCPVSTNCFRHHSSLELLTGGPSNGCPSGYQCLNSKASSNGDLRLFSTSPSPQTLDSFHPALSGASTLFGTTTATAQSFVVGSSTGNWELGSATFMMNETGFWSGFIVAQLWLNTGTPGSGAIPLSGPLLSSTTQVTNNSLTQSGPANTVIFNFPPAPILAPGNYWIGLNASNAPGLASSSGTPVVRVWFNGSDSNHNRAFNQPPPTWNPVNNQNLWFTVTSSFSPSEMLTTTPINTATSASKELLFFEDWHNTTNLSANKGWGWYLTLNSTLPNIRNYNPLNDTSVAVAVVNYGSSTGQGNAYAYVQKQPGISVVTATNLGENPFPNCPQTSTIFICASPNVLYSPNFVDLSLVLNFTGRADNSTNASGFSLLCSQAQPLNLNFCSTTGGLNNPCSPPGANICATRTLPWLNIQSGNYYLGFWSAANQTGNIDFGATQAVSATFAEKANSVYYWVPNPTTATPATTSGESFIGWLGSGLGSVWNVAAGALAPITQPILNSGGSLLSVFISGLIQAGNLLIQGLTVLESIMVAEMNVIGNFIGWGNVGTSMQQLISAMVALLTNGAVGTFFGDLPSIIARLIDNISIAVPWLPIAFNTASNLTLLGVNAIVFIPTLVKFVFFWVSGVFVTVLILFWFIYTGDDALGGMLGFLETTEWFIFGIGLGFVAELVNYFLDIVTYLIGLIPKPFIQMVAHAVPRMPVVQTTANFVSPSFDLGEIRAGNMLSILSWMIGVTFLDWYEQVTPALPGSIGALLPSAASSLTGLAGLLPLLEILTAFVGVAALVFWPLMRIMEFAIGDVGGPAVTMGPGRRLNAGPSGIHIGSGTKHLQGRLEKKLGIRQEAMQEFQKKVAEGRGLEKP